MLAARIATITAILMCLSVSATVANDFRINPYLQNPAPDAMTVMWFSETSDPGTLTVAGLGSFATTPMEAVDLRYLDAGDTADPYKLVNELALLGAGEPTHNPYLNRVRVGGLTAGTTYSYSVNQGSSSYQATFKTAPDANSQITFVVYSDSETEPESTGKKTRWPEPYGDTSRTYVVDQTTGYDENLKVMAAAQPDFIVVAGDLVEAGTEQRDWMEFWKHNAGDDSTVGIASTVPILPVLGNHEVGSQRSSDPDWNAAIAMARYRTYFETPSNGLETPSGATKPIWEDRFYRTDYGPVTLISVDATNGNDAVFEEDTNRTGLNNWPTGEGADFNPGSPQYDWLETELADAAETSEFVFVMFHNAPYSVGPHGFLNEKRSGVPTRVLTPLFKQYGVDAVFGGHDEMYEHSLVEGIHFYDLGVGGDGLRGPSRGLDTDLPTDLNEYQQFLAHLNAAEVWNADQLISGGKHYGHMKVNVFQDEEGRWLAELIPVYVFPLMDMAGTVSGWERRVYDDVVVLGLAGAGGPIPEPSTFALAALGLFSLGFVGWRRRRR